MSAGRIIINILKGIWGVLDVIVDLFVLWLVLLTVVVIASASLRQPHVPASAALVINPHGKLVEERSGNPLDRAVDSLLRARTEPETRLPDVIAAIRAAGADSRIKALVIKPREMAPAPISKLQAIGEAINAFKATDKPVFAVVDSPGQAQYYLAAMADKVLLNPFGAVSVTGFGVYREYYKDAIDKLGIDWNVFRVGKFKSYVEPFTRNSMSKAAKEANSAVLDVLWGAYRKNVAESRGLKAGVISAYADEMPKQLADVNGDMAKLALKTGLVDKLASRDEARQMIAQAVGSGGGSYSQIDFNDYLKATGAGHRQDSGADRVGVIVAEGEILPGKQPRGRIGGESLSNLIRHARRDSHVKALVLRVDSPGGSAFASQLISRQIQLTRDAGKPVVVSMGSVAASGGYWISMAADRIFARPTTITGSVGVLGMYPTLQDSLAKLGVHNDGIGTTALAGNLRPTRAMGPKAKKLFQLTIRHAYDTFVGKVAKTRHLSVDHVRDIAQGRVWSGKDAKRIGLIDEFGGVDEAITAAAQLAGIGDDYSVSYIKRPMSFTSQLLVGLTRNAEAWFGPMSHASRQTPARRALGRIRTLVDRLSRFNDPQGVYAYCFCTLPLQR